MQRKDRERISEHKPERNSLITMKHYNLSSGAHHFKNTIGAICHVVAHSRA